MSDNPGWPGHYEIDAYQFHLCSNCEGSDPCRENNWFNETESCPEDGRSG